MPTRFTRTLILSSLWLACGRPAPGPTIAGRTAPVAAPTAPRAEPAGAPGSATQPAETCEVAVGVDLPGLTGVLTHTGTPGHPIALFGLLDRDLLASVSALGVDPERDFTRALVCRPARKGWDPTELGMRVHGRFPSDLVSKVALRLGLRPGDAGGIPIFSRGRLAIAQRGDAIVLATNPELLRATVNAAVLSPLPRAGSVVSAVLTGRTLQDVFSGRKGNRLAETNSVTRLTGELSADGSHFDVRVTVASKKDAERLTAMVAQLMDDLRTRAQHTGGTPPEAVTRLAGDDVLVRVTVRPDALGSLMRLLDKRRDAYSMQRVNPLFSSATSRPR
jgi:hypothetical protein